MTRNHRRRTAFPVIAAFVTAAVMASSPLSAQDPDWRVVDNPYQEDIEYVVGTTHEPGVEVDGIRWRSFGIVTPERDPFAGGEPIRADVLVEFENRNSKSAKVLVILLLEDEDGAPLDRIEVGQFKLSGNRLKERKVTAELAPEVVDATRRIYIFCEVMDK